MTTTLLIVEAAELEFLPSSTSPRNRWAGSESGGRDMVIVVVELP